MTVEQLEPLMGGLLANAQCTTQHNHREKVSDKGLTESWFALVHKPIKPEEVAKNQEAQKAVDKEWTKLKTMKSKKTQKI